MLDPKSTTCTDDQVAVLRALPTKPPPTEVIGELAVKYFESMGGRGNHKLNENDEYCKTEGMVETSSRKRIHCNRVYNSSTACLSVTGRESRRSLYLVRKGAGHKSEALTSRAESRHAVTRKRKPIRGTLPQCLGTRCTPTGGHRGLSKSQSFSNPHPSSIGWAERGRGNTRTREVIGEIDDVFKSLFGREELPVASPAVVLA